MPALLGDLMGVALAKNTTARWLDVERGRCGIHHIPRAAARAFPRGSVGRLRGCNFIPLSWEKNPRDWSLLSGSDSLKTVPAHFALIRPPYTHLRLALRKNCGLPEIPWMAELFRCAFDAQDDPTAESLRSVWRKI